METVVIRIAGMSCSGCVNSVSSALQALSGVAAVAVTLASGEARVEFNPAQTRVAALNAAIEAAGFDVV